MLHQYLFKAQISEILQNFLFVSRGLLKLLIEITPLSIR